ncbi:MAG: class D sortase [Vicinamibacterales bacterium]
MSDSRLWLQRALTATGVVCLGWFGFVTVDAAMFQREQEAAFERLRAAQALPGPPAELAGSAIEADTTLIGMLDIPRLSVSAPVIEGDDEATLKLAAGHLPDTPRPWEAGNSAIAGHRDGLFRPLKDIRAGDDVFLHTMHGDLRYRVRETKIVMPDDLSVLNQTDEHELTLITCYPFYYIGSAPKRFIVHADRVENVAESAPQAVREERPGDPPQPSAEVRKAPKASSRTAERRKVRKSLTRSPAESRKAQKPIAKVSVDGRKGRASLDKASAEPGKARRFFRKIGAFFKKPKPPHR